MRVIGAAYTMLNVVDCCASITANCFIVFLSLIVREDNEAVWPAALQHKYRNPSTYTGTLIHSLCFDHVQNSLLVSGYRIFKHEMVFGF